MICDKSNNKLFKIIAIIAAGGTGKRMGADRSKQYLELLGRPILAWTIDSFQRSNIVDEIIVIARDGRVELEKWIDLGAFNKIKEIVAGGEERQQSILNGLKAVRDNKSIVIVHDGVRPFFDIDSIEELALTALEVDGVTLGVKVKDTIKAVTNNEVEKTLNRDSLIYTQTPQAFRYDVILDAHIQAIRDSYIGTDDCSLVERLGKKVLVIDGSYDNIKITTQEDLIIGEEIIKRRSGSKE